MPHQPLVLMDVVDTMRLVPDGLVANMGESVKDPVSWAKKCQDEWGADACVLKLASANPEEENRPVEELEGLVKKVLESVSLPLFVYGCGAEEKDARTPRRASGCSLG
jgi:acetyl-CoA decarbonylase/synthase complex subunit delta